MPADVSPAFLLWSELILLWSLFSYVVASDPMADDVRGKNFRWGLWRRLFLARIAGAVVLAGLMAHSIILCCWLGAAVALHPWIRLRSPRKWTAELEVTIVLVNLLMVLAFVRRLHLQSHVSFSGIASAHLAAISLVLAILPFTLRGGTYIVRGFLRKTEALPHKRGTAQTDAGSTDFNEINRGRLIGNLERLVLALVVAAGSYAALAFLVAAKGLVRFEGLRDRDFAEYFLIGSLASVLVALCAGLVIRFMLSLLWPELLSLHIQ
jgi:hypothetical protein